MLLGLGPDGGSVVLERAQSLFDRDDRGDLWVMRADGSDLHRLVTDGQTPSW